MIEVEVKLPVSSLGNLEEQLVKMGFALKAIFRQEDRYYDREDGSVRSSGQALRLRNIVFDDYGETVITFKGKKLDLVSMTRKELETKVNDFSVMDEILNELGFFAVQPIVKKIRREYSCNNMEACLDHVEDLGDFLELEIMAEEECREEALADIEKVLDQLGYKISDTTTNSYLSMLQGVTD